MSALFLRDILSLHMNHRKKRLPLESQQICYMLTLPIVQDITASLFMINLCFPRLDWIGPFATSLCSDSAVLNGACQTWPLHWLVLLLQALVPLDPSIAGEAVSNRRIWDGSLAWVEPVQ